MTRRPKQTKPEEIETEPDGWDRFTKAVKKMAPPKPRRARPEDWPQNRDDPDIDNPDRPSVID